MHNDEAAAMTRTPTNRELDITSLLNRVIEEIERHQYRSHDPYDILGSKPIVWLRQRQSSALSALTAKAPSRNQRLIRQLVSPIYQSSAVMGIYRWLLRIPEVQHPKTMGLMLQTYVTIYRVLGDDSYLDRARLCAAWLIRNTDQMGFGFYCWGLPWEWPSDVTIPRFGPQSTLSAVNALGFVELYEATKDPRYLEVAVSTCEFFLNCLKIDKIDHDKWAFSYTPYDRTHIINVNFHCAALLARVWQHRNDERYLNTLLKVCNFSASEQRPDGAWHYSAKVDGFVNAVDNTHTGDNLEYLTIIRDVLRGEFPYEVEFRKGIEYYLVNFLSPQGMPSYTDTEPFPAESHPAGQMLITLAVLAGLDCRSLAMADTLLLWILNHMMNREHSRIYYRVYETGRVDRSCSISWGDAWLAKGLACLLAANSEATGHV